MSRPQISGRVSEMRCHLQILLPTLQGRQQCESWEASCPHFGLPASKHLPSEVSKEDFQAAVVLDSSSEASPSALELPIPRQIC